MEETTKDRILSTAIGAFAMRGYEGTTLSQIAGAVGIQKPSIYNHFSGKAELFYVIAEKIMKEMVDALRKSATDHADLDLKRKMYAVLVDCSHFIFQKHQGMIYKRMMLFPPPNLSEELYALAKAGDEKIDEVLQGFYEQGQHEKILRSLSLQEFSSAFYCLMDGLFTESFIYREEEFRERFEASWSIYWAGVVRKD